MSHLDVIALLAPLAEKSGPGITPYLVGAAVLALLFGAMLALLAFGKGREHS